MFVLEGPGGLRMELLAAEEWARDIECNGNTVMGWMVCWVSVYSLSQGWGMDRKGNGGIWVLAALLNSVDRSSGAITASLSWLGGQAECKNLHLAPRLHLPFRNFLHISFGVGT